MRAHPLSRARRSAAIVASIAVVLAAQFVPADARARGPRFTPYVSLTGGWAEPGVITGSGQTVFVDAPPGKLWRSTDGGRSFSEINFGLAGESILLAGGGDSDTLVRGNRVYYTDLWIGSNSILRSDDLGASWTQMTPVSTLGLSDRQWLALGPRDANGDDTVYAVYALIQPPYQVMFTRSRDSGLTWDFHTATPSLLGARGYTGPLVARGNYVAFPWIDGNTLSIAYSTNAGQLWSSSVVSRFADEGSFPVAALDGDRLHVVWTDNVYHRVRYRAMSTSGRGLSVSRVVSGADLGAFPWVAARRGKVAIAWYGATVSERVAPGAVPADTVWRARYAESVNNGRRFSAPVTVGPGKTGDICTDGLGCTSGRELGDYLSIDIRPDGKSVIAFGGDVPGAIKVARQR